MRAELLAALLLCLTASRQTDGIYLKRRQRREVKPSPLRSLYPSQVKDVNDPMAAVLADVIRQLGGGPGGKCHVLLYYDAQTVSDQQLKELQIKLAAPVSLLDVSAMNFGLVTVKNENRGFMLLKLLMNRPDEEKCRILVSWSAPHFQRGLLILSRIQPGLIKKQDVLVLPTKDERIGKFLPEMRQRVIVRQRAVPRGRSLKQDTKPRSGFVIESTCNNCINYELEKRGEWQDHQGLTWKKKEEQKEEKKGLSGTHLIVSYTPSIPNIFNIDNETKDGLEYRMLKYVSVALNFTFDLVKPPDGQWGRYINKTWTGKIGEVIYKRADLAIGGIVYQRDRARYATYSIMFHNELWGIVCPNPLRLPLWPYIMFPFRGETGPSVFSFLVVMHILAFLLVTFVGQHNKEIKKEKIPPLAKSIQNVFRVSLSLYLRLLTCLYFWNLFYCIIKPAYEDPIDSALALTSSNKRWGLVSGTTVAPILSNSLDSSHRRAVEGARSFSSISEGLKELEYNGLCIVGVPKRYAKSKINTRYTTKCGEPALHVSAEDLHVVKGGWLMTSKSGLKEKLDPIILRLQSFGLLNKWRSDLYAMLSTKRKEKLPCIKRPVGSLTLAELRLAFYLLIAGIVCSIGLFVAEIFIVYILGKYGRTTLPWQDDMETSTSIVRQRQLRSMQQTWPEQLIRQVAQEKGKKKDLLIKEAMFRYHLALLLKNAALPPLIVPEYSISAITDSGPSGNTTLSTTQNHCNRSMQSQQIPTTSTSNIEILSTNSIPTENVTPPHISPEASPTLVTVQPYQSTLGRASKLLPWNYLRNATKNIGTSPRLPETPLSPLPTKLPPLTNATVKRFKNPFAQYQQACKRKGNQQDDALASCSSDGSQQLDDDEVDVFKMMRQLFASMGKYPKNSDEISAISKEDLKSSQRHDDDNQLNENDD